MMSAYLTREELASLTGHVRKLAQVRELQAMGVPHLVRRDGSPVVAWKDARPWDVKAAAPVEPNFGALSYGQKTQKR